VLFVLVANSCGHGEMGLEEVLLTGAVEQLALLVCSNRVNGLRFATCTTQPRPMGLERSDRPIQSFVMYPFMGY
jgi:hypothetical protein